jgi:hypothetical protein
MDSLAQRVEALRERSNAAIVTFLQADLELAHTFCKLGKSAADLTLFDRNLYAAQTAVETVSRIMWKTKMKPRELDNLTAQLGLLKFELESLN